MDQYVRLGQYIKERPERLGLSQADVVKHLRKSDIPTSEAVFSRLENGHGGKTHWGDAKFVEALAKILRISPMELLSITGHIDRLDVDISTLRIIELANKLDPKQRETAEQILKILVAQQEKDEGS